MPTRAVVFAALLTALPIYRLTAQCPDGSPPPCGRRAARPAAPVIDPNRIAILPFRVTTADTLLGEGVAELLSAEFNGDRVPQAAHMGTVIRAWRQAGGAPRRPLRARSDAQGFEWTAATGARLEERMGIEPAPSRRTAGT